MYSIQQVNFTAIISLVSRLQWVKTTAFCLTCAIISKLFNYEWWQLQCTATSGCPASCKLFCVLITSLIVQQLSNFNTNR